MKTPAVAVVDDEAPVRVALRRLLRLADYTVTTFESGEEFLASLDTAQPDCVLLDVNLPTMSGPSAYKEMLQHGAPKVLFMTGDPDAKVPAEASERKVLMKPFGFKELIESLQLTMSFKEVV